MAKAAPSTLDKPPRPAFLFGSIPITKTLQLSERFLTKTLQLSCRVERKSESLARFVCPALTGNMLEHERQNHELQNPCRRRRLKTRGVDPTLPAKRTL